MRGLVLPLRFNAIVAWDSFFHLSRDEQRFTAVVAPGAAVYVRSAR
jgi:hypothetical protein